MAPFSLLRIVATLLIISTNIIDGQRSSYIPKIERFISKPDYDDNDHPLSPLSRFPMGPGPIAPMPFLPRPLLGGIGSPLGFNPLTRMLPGPYPQHNPYLSGIGFGGRPQRQEEIYTAIGYDKSDPTSQVRLTITERRPQGLGGMNYPSFGGSFFQGMDFGDDYHVNYDTPTTWYVQGAFLGSQMTNKAGTYHLVLTQSGRTVDGCAREALGPIVTSNNMMNNNNPYLQQQNSGPSGAIVANQVIVGNAGPTVYASTLEGVSRRQLVGAGLAACQYINNGMCGGYIPFCATVTKDILPAMEVPLTNNNPSPMTMTFDPFQNQNFGFQQGGDSGSISFAEQDRSASAFNNPQSLAIQGQRTGSDDAIGLLF